MVLASEDICTCSLEMLLLNAPNYRFKESVRFLQQLSKSLCSYPKGLSRGGELWEPPCTLPDFQRPVRISLQLSTRIIAEAFFFSSNIWCESNPQIDLHPRI